MSATKNTLKWVLLEHYVNIARNYTPSYKEKDGDLYSKSKLTTLLFSDFMRNVVLIHSYCMKFYYLTKDTWAKRDHWPAVCGKKRVVQE